MSAIDAKTKKRLRFVILEVIYEQHEQQRHRHNDVTLTGVLDRLHYEVYVDLVRALLQDLREREMIDFQSDKDRITGKASISKIEIRPKGRDLVESKEDDPLAEV